MTLKVRTNLYEYIIIPKDNGSHQTHLSYQHW